MGSLLASGKVITITKWLQGERPGLVVRPEDSRPRGCGFESRSILDGFEG